MTATQQLRIIKKLQHMRAELTRRGWTTTNDTPLNGLPAGHVFADIDSLHEAIVNRRTCTLGGHQTTGEMQRLNTIMYKVLTNNLVYIPHI